MVRRRFAVHHQLGPRHGEVDADVEELALMMAAVWSVDDDVAAHDRLVILLQVQCALADPLLECPG
jgi:hypothetical protein